MIIFKFIRIILTVVIGIFYFPINVLNGMSQKFYFKMKKEDRVIYHVYTPFYWLLFGITFIISLPYEFLIAVDLD